MLELLTDEIALERATTDRFTELTCRATGATYYADDLTTKEIAFIDRVVRISAECVTGAARNPHQLLVTSMSEGRLAGFMIATLHSEDDRELDWLMVDPDFHGNGIASSLMRAGVEWLGENSPIWLNVVRHNERAIGFYRKHGFEIDPEAECPHVMPHWIMRRG